MRRLAVFLLASFIVAPRLACPQGGPLGPEFRVNTYITNDQYEPSVASDSAGNFVVVWRSDYQDGSGPGTFGQRFASSGNALGPEFRVNTFTTGPQFGGTVAGDASGNFVAVWTSLQGGSSYGIFAQRYASSGIPLGAEFRVNTSTSGEHYEPSVASDSAGNFVVVWTGQDYGVSAEILGRRYASSGVPLGAEFRVNTYLTGGQYLPAVASDTAGNFVVVWTSDGQDGSLPGVFGQRFASSGIPLGPEFRVNTHTTDFQYHPHLAADSAGNFVVVWTSKNQDGSYAIFGQRYASSGTPLGTEFRVNPFDAFGFQVAPSVASDPAGSFVVTWSRADGSAFGVFGQRYLSSGAPLGPAFVVNTYTTGDQLISAMATDAAGNFVVIWGSTFQDGSGIGVFGQRYNMIVPVELMHFRVE